MNVLAVSGSLRSESTNSHLLRAAQALASPYFNLHVTDRVRTLPLFDPDLQADTLDAVGHWTQEMRNADGLIVSTPEYARGYPGALKNALDWLVQGDGFVAKPFMFFIASPRATYSHTTLKTVLETMSGIHVADADATIPLLGGNYTTQDIIDHPDWSSTLKASLDTFARFIGA